MTKRAEVEAVSGRIEDCLDQYLTAGPVPPMKAYALGLRGRLQMVLGNEEAAIALMQEAASVDPFYSKASAVPPSWLFSKPGEESPSHLYFFRFT